MNFIDAVKMMSRGLSVSRTKWDEPRLAVTLDAMDIFRITDITHSILCNSTAKNIFNLTKEDILADDWELTR